MKLQQYERVTFIKIIFNICFFTVAVCSYTDWHNFRFIVVLQQKAQEHEKRLLHIYSHLHWLTTIFSKITEIILEDYEMPALYMRKIPPYQKITSILKLVFHLHYMHLHLQTQLQSINVTINSSSNWIWLAWPSAFLLSKLEALFLQRWSNLRSFECASIAVLWCKLLCNSSCFPYRCFFEIEK